MPKDGDEVLNTRSIGIIENGGILIQAKNFNTNTFFPELSDLITFNSEKELLDIDTETDFKIVEEFSK